MQRERACWREEKQCAFQKRLALLMAGRCREMGERKASGMSRSHVMLGPEPRLRN